MQNISDCLSRSGINLQNSICRYKAVFIVKFHGVGLVVVWV